MLLLGEDKTEETIVQLRRHGDDALMERLAPITKQRRMGHLAISSRGSNQTTQHTIEVQNVV
jgi:hypothetical protein